MRRPTVGAAVPAARTGMAVEIRRTWRRNSEEQQKATLTLRLDAPQVPLRNTGEQVFRETASRSGGAAGGRGLPPLPWGWRAGGRGLPPLPLVGGGAGEASGGTLGKPLSPIGVC